MRLPVCDTIEKETAVPRRSRSRLPSPRLVCRLGSVPRPASPLGLYFPVLAACCPHPLSGPLGAMGSSTRSSGTVCVQSSALDMENVVGVSVLTDGCQGFRCRAGLWGG